MLDQPENVTVPIRKMLSGQRSFSQLSVEGIFESVALNSLKSAANKVLENESETLNGWALINDMRIALYERTKNLQSTSRRNVKTKSSIKEINNAKEIARHAELMANQCSIAYLDLFSKVVNIVTAEPGLDDRSRFKLHNILCEHKIMYGKLLSPPSDESHELKLIQGGLVD